MPITHNSLASLQDSVNSLIRDGDLETPLEMIQAFVERIVSDPQATGRVFSAPALDELCLRLGAQVLSQTNVATPAPSKGRIVYLATEFYRQGGHTLLAADFVRYLPDREHVFLITDILSNPHRDAPDLRLVPLGAKVEVAPTGPRLEKLRWLLTRLFELAPEKIYWFNHHQDTVAIAAAQPAIPGDKYFIHHADHQLCLGVHTPHLHHVDLANLGFFNCRHVLGIAINHYWPLVSDDLGPRDQGRRFIEAGRLRTCSSGSAKKFEIPYLYDYGDVLARVLRATEGDHVHVGFLSEEYLERIRRRLANEEIPQERFVHVSWVPSLWRALIEREVDVYLPSWPIGGGKALIEAMGAGIPSVVHVNYISRFHSGFDVAYAEAPTWRTPTELADLLGAFTPESLAFQSLSARAHYEKHHTPEILASLLRGEAGAAPAPIPLRDYHPDRLQIFLDERAQRDSQIANLNQVVAERDGRIANFNQVVAERDGRIAALSQAVTERDGQATNLKQAVAEREEHIINLNQVVAERDGRIAALSQAVTERDGQATNLKQAVAEREERVASLNRAISERDGQITNLSHSLTETQNSTSWRVTAPLRSIGSQIWRAKRLYRQLRYVVSRQGGAAGALGKSVRVLNSGGAAAVFQKLKSIGNLSDPLTTTAVDGRTMSPINTPTLVVAERDGQISALTKVSILMLGWNGFRHTKHAIESLFKTKNKVPAEIFLFDNGSTDETPKYFSRMPSINYVRSECNLGYSKAVNKLIAKTAADSDIVLLNNDLTIEQHGWLDELQSVAYSEPDIGIVGCRIRRPSGEFQHAGTYIMPETMWGQQIGSGQKDIGQYPYIREVESVVFAAVYIKRDVINKVGLLDERFFAYFEDTDYCLRARKASYKIVCCGKVTVDHLENTTVKENDLDFNALFQQSRTLFTNKWKDELERLKYSVDLTWTSILNVATGYANSSRALIRELERQGVRVSYKYAYGPGTPFPILEPQGTGEYLLDVVYSRNARSNVEVVFAQGDVFKRAKAACSVGFTMLEVDRIPDEWVRQSNEMTEVWVPSQFNLETFRFSGVSKRVEIMPLGVDCNFFNSFIKGQRISDAYTFLANFEWGERKAPELLLQAYLEEFRPSENVLLVLKIMNRDPSVDVQKMLATLVGKTRHAQIVLSLNEHIPEYQLGMLYNSVDCYVTATRGEGWGMPILEAMACGCPVIATNWSAHKDFMRPLIDFTVNPASLIPAEAKCPYYKGANWAEPDFSQLRREMRRAFELGHEARAMSLSGIDELRARWGTDVAARKIKDRVIHLAEKNDN